MSSVNKRFRPKSGENDSDRDSILQGKANAKQAIMRKGKKGGDYNKMGYYAVIGVFVFVCLAAIFFLVLHPQRSLSQIPVMEEDKIIVHNSQNYAYKQGFNKMFKDWSLADAKSIFSNSLSSKNNINRCASSSDELTQLPEKFDAREQWPNCISDVQTQSNCSASYAMASLSAFSDRLCIFTEGQYHPKLAPQEVVSCDSYSYGCKGGYVNQVFEYGQRIGFHDEECFPYEASETECKSKCNEDAPVYKVHSQCLAQGPDAVKRELYKYGPVVAAMTVYTDFLVYSDGMYHLTEESSKFNGQHIVKIIGWSNEESGRESWLIQNTWGTDWGKDGYATVSRQRDFGLDSFAIAPLPIFERGQSAVENEEEEIVDIDKPLDE